MAASFVDKLNSLSLNQNPFYGDLLLELRKTFPNLPHKIPSKKSVDVFRDKNSNISCKEKERPFFCLYLAANETMSPMRYNCPVFLDGTFRETPHIFYTYFIAMVFVQVARIHVICVYGLRLIKKEYMYREFHHQIITLMKYS
ncbi:hypothetical protein HZS_7692 [Henneguya salminicola]|nr:hypothetical protein HZS_7692 [Henneguya salminicola]